jgi:hypothetical protein
MSAGTYEIWRHKTSGDAFAVHVTENGTVLAAAGPLHYTEHDGALADGFDADADLADELNADAESYRLERRR